MPTREIVRSAVVAAAIGNCYREHRRGDECGNACGRILLYTDSVSSGFCAICRGECGGYYENVPQGQPLSK